MIILRTVPELRAFVNGWKRVGGRIGLVPTMGYLHEGHLSLVDRLGPRCDKIITSIFVNPKQFAPGEDLDRYPRDFDRDEKLLAGRGVDALFYPANEVMYPAGFLTYVDVEKLGENLCGRSRPNHFRGVTTVVSKLFLLTKCDAAAFGQKDYQQARIIQRMVEDLNFDIEIVICPIVREPDGLAMSSRNVYLTHEERKNALGLHRALEDVRILYNSGERAASLLIRQMQTTFQSIPNLKIDYLDILDAGSLQSIGVLTGRSVAVIAAFVGKTRLIDNVILEAKG
ncbi:MAG: pantoate--beta-alanine ligase [bacterium]|nr:pantoate--beta-alanine ligase [bacterium]